MNGKNITKISFLTIAFLFFSICTSIANPADSAKIQKTAEQEHTGKFNAGEMIFEHILDAHQWHILSIGHTHIAIPLPIILIDNGKIVLFSSSKFDDGATYNGYKLETEGKHKGKIVKTKLDGTVDEEAKLPLDFSITKTVFALLFSALLLCIIFISVANKYKKNRNKAPKGLQSLMEMAILFVRDDVAKPSIGEHKYEKFMPYLMTVFFFIFFNNLLGLIPIPPAGANVTGNIAITMILAVCTFIITTFSANKNYWKHIINAPGVPWWLKIPIPLMPIVELIGVITKPFVLMVRLFANITAGHIIILGFISLIFVFGEMNTGAGIGASVITIAFSIFMSLLELLVAFIQAYVFTLLSALYFGMAIEEHH